MLLRVLYGILPLDGTFRTVHTDRMDQGMGGGCQRFRFPCPRNGGIVKFTFGQNVVITVWVLILAYALMVCGYGSFTF